MKKILIYTILAAGIGISSCERDLDIINPNEPTLGVFWESAQDAEQGVNAIYSTFKREGTSRWLPMLHTVRSDVGYSASPWSDLANALDKFIQPDYNFGPVAVVWRDNYVGIFRANQVLENVPDIEMEEGEKQRLLGEAYFLRAFFYYHLASLWGNVPLMLDPSTPQDVPPTVSREEVWAQVEQDLIAAADMLPASYSSPSNVGRATKGAANALLAKVYMQQNEYEQALQPLQWLVQGEGSGVYELMPDYRDNFLVTTENNRESVFEIQYAINPTETTDDDVATANHNYGTSIAQFYAPRGIGWSDAQAHRWVVHEFQREETVEEERDPRLAATFIFDSTDVRGPEFTDVYGQSFAQRYGRDNREVWFRKFLNDHWKNEEGYRSPNNWRFIRYSDVLLMYAETLNALGRTAEAYQHVDRVRQRVNLPALSDVRPGMGQDEFLEQIKHERLLELAGEGHRWNDLARWDDLGQELADRDPAFANFREGQHELLPIPQRDLDINPNLEQNPQW
jgi:hypothetical protein